MRHYEINRLLFATKPRSNGLIRSLICAVAAGVILALAI